MSCPSCRWPGAGSCSSTRGASRPPALAHPRVPRLVRGGPDPADGGRRRRDADLRDLAAPPRLRRRDRRLGAARARDRRRRDARARGRRVRARVGHYDVGAYLWIEGMFVVGTIVLAVVALLARGPARCSRCLGAAVAPAARSSGRALALRGHPRLPRPRRAARRVVRGHVRATGLARARDLARRRSPPGSTSRRASST